VKGNGSPVPPQDAAVPDISPLVSTWRQLLAVPVIELIVRDPVVVASPPTYRSPAPMVAPRVPTTSVDPRLNQPVVVALPSILNPPIWVEEALLTLTPLLFQRIAAPAWSSNILPASSVTLVLLKDAPLTVKSAAISFFISKAKDP